MGALSPARSPSRRWSSAWVGTLLPHFLSPVFNPQLTVAHFTSNAGKDKVVDHDQKCEWSDEVMPHAVPLWRVIRDDLRARIKAGILKPGDKLPSTRELADQYETSPVTVRKAVDILIESGELLGRQGMGVFVAIPPASDR